MTTPRSVADVLGGSRELAIFEAFATRGHARLSAADVERHSGVSWATVHRRLNEWVTSKVVEPAGKEGKAVLYTLNTDSAAVRALAKAINIAILEMFESDLAEEGMPEDELQHRPTVRVLDRRLTRDEAFGTQMQELHERSCKVVVGAVPGA